jgi:hypothetical protein
MENDSEATVIGIFALTLAAQFISCRLIIATFLLFYADFFQPKL